MSETYVQDEVDTDLPPLPPQGGALSRIEEKIDKQVAGGITFGDGTRIAFRDMREVFEFAKMMSISQEAVPPHCREKPGVCLAITIQALSWGMEPFAVASKSYLVNGRIAYESQLVHALIEARAPLRGRLRHEYFGEGDEMRCRIIGHVRNEQDPLIFESETVGKLKNPKGSPLWFKKPALQLFYNASRDWCRVHFPDVLLGIYSADEMAEAEPMGGAAAASPRLMDRLPARQAEAEGFDADAATKKTGNAKTGGNEAKRRRKASASASEPSDPTPTAPETENAPGGAVLPPDGVVTVEHVQRVDPKTGEVTDITTINTPEPTAPTVTVESKVTVAEPAPKAPVDAETWQEYVALWQAKLEGTVGPKSRDDWKSERQLRSRLGMPLDQVEELRDKIEARIASFIDTKLTTNINAG